MTKKLISGFSLLEILLVIAIIAIVTGAAVLAVGAGDVTRTARVEAERFSALLELACERAALSGLTSGVRLESAQYSFDYLRGKSWLNYDEESLRQRTLPKGLHWSVANESRALVQENFDRDGTGFSLELNQSDNKPNSPERNKSVPSIQCFSSGEMTPFELQIGLIDETPLWIVRGDLDARINIQSVSNNE